MPDQNANEATDSENVIFEVDGISTDWGMSITEDGVGVVIWNGDEFYILDANITIQFNDQSVDTSYLFDDNGSDGVFTIDDDSTDWRWDETEDGLGIVVWKGDAFHVLDADVKIQFNDKLIDTTGYYSSQIINGTAGVDQIFGSLGNDIVYGGGGGDLIRVYGGGDVVYGGDGGDLIMPDYYEHPEAGYIPGGDDRIDGGDGLDSVAYGGLVSDFSFERVDADTVTVSSAGTGTDTLIDVEQIYFQQDGGKIAKLRDLVEGNNKFTILYNSEDWGWGVTQDGQGVVAWSLEDTQFQVFDASVTLRFNDKTVYTSSLFDTVEAADAPAMISSDFMEGDDVDMAALEIDDVYMPVFDDMFA